MNPRESGRNRGGREGANGYVFRREFCPVCADRGDQFSRRDFVTHFAVNAGLAFVDFDQKNALAVICRFEA